MQTQAASRPSFVLRQATRPDEGYIATSWLGAYQSSDPAYRKVDRGRLQRSVLPLIEDILKRADCRVAAPYADSRTIYGFAVLEPGLIHMVYVRPAWRRLGLANALLQGVNVSECAWSTQSEDFREWIRHKYPMKEYRPFWLIERKASDG